jgi:hypothetical protein
MIGSAVTVGVSGTLGLIVTEFDGSWTRGRPRTNRKVRQLDRAKSRGTFTFYHAERASNTRDPFSAPYEGDPMRFDNASSYVPN